MSLASEVTTWQETTVAPSEAEEPTVRFRSRIRTNVGPERLKRKLEALGLMAMVESIERYHTNWHWTGTGQGYEIVWQDTATVADLLPLARL